jgi:hypothetical protein
LLRGFEALFVASAHRDLGALVNQSLGEGETQSVSSSGNEHGAMSEF